MTQTSSRPKLIFEILIDALERNSKNQRASSRKSEIVSGNNNIDKKLKK